MCSRTVSSPQGNLYIFKYFVESTKVSKCWSCTCPEDEEYLLEEQEGFYSSFLDCL